MASVMIGGISSVVPKCNSSNISTKQYSQYYSSLLQLQVPRKSNNKSGNRRVWKVMASENMTSESSSEVVVEKLGVKIHRNPPESKLSQLGVRNWPKWGCAPSKFPWTYSSKETCYLLKGKVKVYPDGSDEAVEFGAGDLVVFPNGMSCTWDVSETVDKHYKFE